MSIVMQVMIAAGMHVSCTYPAIASDAPLECLRCRGLLSPWEICNVSQITLFIWQWRLQSMTFIGIRMRKMHANHKIIFSKDCIHFHVGSLFSLSTILQYLSFLVVLFYSYELFRF